MTDTITVALISAGSGVLVSITALILNYQGFTSINSRLGGIDARFSSIEARMLALETSMTARFDLILGKLADFDTRLSIVEDRLDGRNRPGGRG